MTIPTTCGNLPICNAFGFPGNGVCLHLAYEVTWEGLLSSSYLSGTMCRLTSRTESLCSGSYKDVCMHFRVQYLLSTIDISPTTIRGVLEGKSGDICAVIQLPSYPHWCRRTCPQCFYDSPIGVHVSWSLVIRQKSLYAPCISSGM